MCVHALLGTTALAAGGTGFSELFPLAMHLELPVEPRPYRQKYAAVARWNTSPVSALLLVWATVKRLEFSLSSQKEASLLFWGEGHPRKSRDTETHQGKDTSKAYSLLMTRVSLWREGLSCAADMNYSLDRLPQFYYLTPGTWVK